MSGKLTKMHVNILVPHFSVVQLVLHFLVLHFLRTRKKLQYNRPLGHLWPRLRRLCTKDADNVIYPESPCHYTFDSWSWWHSAETRAKNDVDGRNRRICIHVLREVTTVSMKTKRDDFCSENLNMFVCMNILSCKFHICSIAVKSVLFYHNVFVLWCCTVV